MIRDGSVAWSVECPMTAAPAAGDGLVYAGSEDLIEARAEGDGAAQWRRPVQGRVVSLHWDTGWLFAQTEPGSSLAIRAQRRRNPLAEGFRIAAQRATGARLGTVSICRSKTAGSSRFRSRPAMRSGRSKLAEPAVGILPVGDRVFIGARDNQFYSLSAEDGDDRMALTARAPTCSACPCSMPGGCISSRSTTSCAGHNRNGGSMLWKQVLPVRPFTGPLLSGDTLIVAGVAAELHGYNTADGKSVGPTFTLKGAENEEMLLAAPPHLTAQDSLILVTKGGQVRAVGSPAPAAAPAPLPPRTRQALLKHPRLQRPDAPPTDAPSSTP